MLIATLCGMAFSYFRYFVLIVSLFFLGRALCQKTTVIRRFVLIHFLSSLLKLVLFDLLIAFVSFESVIGRIRYICNYSRLIAGRTTIIFFACLLNFVLRLLGA